MAPANDPKVQDLVSRLRSVFDPCTIYLFGSRAVGKARDDSDFDVMVVVPVAEGSHFQRHVRAAKVMRGFPSPVDLIVYTKAEWEFMSPKMYSVARQVIDTGVIVHAV